MNQQQIQQDFETILKGKSWWQRFVGSQFVEGISLFIGQVFYVVVQAAQKALGEAFLSTATKRASILAAAEDKGYVGRRVTPSFGTVSVKNKTNRVLHLPVNAHFLSRDQLVYLIREPVELAAGETKSVDVTQLELVQVSKQVTAKETFLAVLLPKSLTATASKVDVYVEQHGKRELWKKAFMFRASNASSKVYVEFYKPTEQLGIRFGDGVNGLIPPVGSTVVLDVWCTDGDTMLVEGQKLTPIGDIAGLDSQIEVITQTPITGGAPAESTEETRQGAMYSTAYDEQIVWGGDYIHFIRTNLGGLTWLRVWGESEEEQSTGVKSLSNINSIFITGHKPALTQEALEAEIFTLLDTVPDKLNKHFKYRPANYMPFKVTVNAQCATHLVPEDIKAKLADALETRFGKDSTEIQNGILLKDLWTFIDDTGLLLDYTLVHTGLMEPTLLNDFVYLDVTGSDIKVSY